MSDILRNQLYYLIRKSSKNHDRKINVKSSIFNKKRKILQSNPHINHFHNFYTK